MNLFLSFLKHYNKQLKAYLIQVYIMSTASNTATPSTLYTGRVKWFNNKAGYGFITVVSTPQSSDVEKNTDVFTHHSSIQVNEEQYKYLVQGEYVQFSLTTVEDGDHKYQAQTVSGIGGGQLLCETRNEVRSAAPPRRQSSRPPRSSSDRDSRPQYRGTGPREGARDDEEWVLTRRKASTRRSANRSEQSDSH
jgi:cold shock CspA family protein|uniref:CSD domain-containing protein n=1 Tax=viral metagenome TaxID=1070528 RepID=A0A6C0CZB4_9ZZZZ